MSSRVAATTRNSVVRDRSGEACIKAMNSSVTWASATSVMSSFLRAIRDRRRSNGPSKTGSDTAKRSNSPWTSRLSGRVATGYDFPRESTVGVRARMVGSVRSNRLGRHRRVWELDGTADARIEHEVAECLL